MSVDLGPLPEGNYRVRWVTLSPVDGHYLVGTFPFSVGPAAAPAGGAAEAGASSGLPVPAWLPVLLRYIALAGALGWGGIAFAHAFVVGPWLAREAHRLARLSMGLSRRYNQAVVVAALLLLTGRLLEVAWPALATGGLGEVSAGWRASLAVLGTRFSLVSWGVVALAILAVVLASRTVSAVAIAGGADVACVRSRPRLGRWTEARAARGHVALAALAMLGLAATGHAAAVSGLYNSSLAAAWLHYLAASVWVGGVFYFAGVLLPTIAASETDVRRHVWVAVSILGRFTPYALLAGLVLAATGLLRAEVHLPSLAPKATESILGTTYGQVLVAKVSLVILMATVGVVHSFGQRRRLERLVARGAEKDELQRSLSIWRKLVQGEAAAALALLALVALLLTTPALRYGFERVVPAMAGAGNGGTALAQAFLEKAEQSMNALSSARAREKPAGSNSAGWTDYVLVAPAGMRIQSSNGDETIVWWNLMFTRRSGETAWQVGFWSPVYRFTWPNYVWSKVAYRPTLLGHEVVSGVRCAIVSFTDATGSVRQTLWIGEADGLVRREEVEGLGYHVVREYFDFNAPLEVTFPEDVPHN